MSTKNNNLDELLFKNEVKKHIYTNIHIYELQQFTPQRLPMLELLRYAIERRKVMWMEALGHKVLKLISCFEHFIKR